MFAEKLETRQLLAGDLVDDLDPGFAIVGTQGTDWDTQTSSDSYNGSGRELYTSGNSVATWTFDNLQPGVYQVSGHWADQSDRASNVEFKIFDGTALVQSVAIDQQFDPTDDVLVNGTGFQHLGGLVSVTGTQLVVELPAEGDADVVSADAIRIERVADLPADQGQPRYVRIERLGNVALAIAEEMDLS
ncbi:MAG: hypothetical protein MI861_01250, partial [Pirellulales bacterium]|nr:hypothetical protein [Pirellulales bacterium]